MNREMKYFDEVFEEERSRRSWNPRKEKCKKRIKRAYTILKEEARSRGVITYGELMSKIGTSRGYIGLVLDGINRIEHKQDHPILSAIVVKANTKMPGDGFFDLLVDLGLRDKSKSKSEQWMELRDKVYKFWKK